MTPFLLLSALLSAGALAAESIVGEVVKAPAHDERRFLVKRDDGGELAVAFADGTRFLQARPGATTLEDARPSSAGDLVAGDRVLCRGTRHAPGTPWTASLVVVMRRADLAEQRAREREDWRRRGLSGLVTAIDPAAGELTMRLAGSGTQLVVACDARTVFRRYAPGSLRFADALPSSLAGIEAGDQVRALADRGADPARVRAQQVVSGAFRVVRGVLFDIDASNSVVSVRETPRADGAPHGRQISVTLGKGTLLRRLPPPLVVRLLRMSEGGTRGAGSAADSSGPPGTPDPDELLERLPPIGLQDLRKGDELAALGPRGPDGGSLTAIKLVVWTLEAPSDARTRGRRNGGEEPADPFTDLLGFGGEPAW